MQPQLWAQLEVLVPRRRLQPELLTLCCLSDVLVGDIESGQKEGKWVFHCYL